MELTIELVGRGGRNFDLLQVEGERIRIGRAFDNDIVLSDPHVCPHHAVIESDEQGNIQLRDLGSVNGTYTSKHQALDNSIIVTSGDEFILGKSCIRIYRRDHAVPASISLTWVENLAHFAGRPLVAGSVILLAVLISLFSQYAGAIKEFNISRELITTIGVILLICLWPACWTVYSRFKKHEPHFITQLSVTMLYVVIVTLMQKLLSWLAFHFGLSLSLGLFSIVVFFVLSLLLIWANYYLAVFLNNRRRWVYSLLLTSLLGSFAYLGHSFDADRFKRRPEYAAQLFLPAVTFYSTSSIDTYLDDADYIFADSASLAEKN